MVEIEIMQFAKFDFVICIKFCDFYAKHKIFCIFAR